MRPQPHRKGRWGLSRTVFTLAAGAVLALTASVTPAAASPDPGPEIRSGVIAPQLASEVAEASPGERITALLMLHNPTRFTQQGRGVIDELRAHAAETQHEIEVALEQNAETAGDVVVVNRFWITNMMLIEFTADTQRLNALASLPGVRRVIPNFTVTAPEPAPGDATTPTADQLTWGLEKIQADRVWSELGVTGTGVRVATLDTGVDINHPDLAGKMVTDDPSDPSYPGGWMEFNSSGGMVPSQPHDSAYHGTHVSGTIHGGDTSGTAIGVAPDAEMMHGLVIPGGSGTFAQVAAGMQWAVAPTDANGNPAGEPADVVNMSLGANGFYEEMIAPTRAMRAAGIFPAFAIGNNCTTGGTASPGNVYDAVGVGATDSADNVAGFSCGGVVQKSQWTDPPADWPNSYVKPDISAPGVDVYSASPGGGYRTLSGTSMATPHTAGTVALMRSAAPELTVEQILSTLIDTAYWDDRYAQQPPDTRFGHGRINAYEATREVAIDSGITGTVTDAATGEPISDATVSVVSHDRELSTDADGRYVARLEPGTYSLEISAFGYDSTTVENITVSANSFTKVDVVLTPGPRGAIAGTVTLEETGAGIPGVTVSLRGTPRPFTTTTGSDGKYTIPNIPVGSYEVVASHPRFVAPDSRTVEVTDAGTATADFGFGPPPRSVAVVGVYADKFVDEVFAPRGIEAVEYDWDELLEAAEHPTVILGYGYSSDYDPDLFQQFLDVTDANGTGVIFTHHAFGTLTGISALSRHTGQPESTGQNSSGTGSAESFYTITAEHPIFDGLTVGDRIVLDNSTQAKWIGWFDGYSGDGRQTIATIGRSGDSVGGGGIGVDQRANNRHVLLASHGVSATRGPADWTPEATQLFLNAIAWASPPPAGPQAYFALHDLRVEPDLVKSGEPVTIQAEVKNVGGAEGNYQPALRVGSESVPAAAVTLAPGESATLSWTVSRTELGSYQVELEYLRGAFRVRAPIVDLTATTVAGTAQEAGPLAGATVELIDNGTVISVGTTDADGKLAFEIPAPSGEYQLVVRRDHVAEGDEAYLLHRTITVTDDQAVTMAPRAASDAGANAVVRADLALHAVNTDHTAQVFVRPTRTAPYGYGFGSGVLIASVDRYDVVPVHRVNLMEQEWYLPGQVISGVDWSTAGDQLFRFGGKAGAEVSATAAEDGTSTVNWRVTDAYGRPFATVLSGDLRPFATLPEVVELEQIVGLLRSAMTHEYQPVLRLFDPTGTQLRAGGIGWDAQPYPFTLDPEALGGEYQLRLEANVGGYGDPVTATGAMQVGDIRLDATRPAAVVTKSTWEYRMGATNSGDATGPLTWTIEITSDRGALSTKDVTLRVRDGKHWKTVKLTAREDGTLVGTISDSISLPQGETSWQLSLKITKDGGYTIVDRFSGDGVAVATHDQVTVAGKVHGKVGSGDNRFAGLGV